MQLNRFKVAGFLALALCQTFLLQAQKAAKQHHEIEIEDDEQLPTPPKNDIAELAKKVANPVSNLINVPFRNNGDYGIGALNGTRNTLNIQPVVPFSLGKNFTLLTRTILPIISQYNITGVGKSQNGLGDISFTAFVSPVKTKNGIIWALGPAFIIPAATNDFFASKKFSIGPSAVLLRQTNGFTYGSLLSQVWSIAGSDTRQNISQMLVQPFFSYNWKSGASISANAEWTQNWNNNTTIVYFTPTVGGLTRLGKQNVALSVGPRFNIAAPSEVKADWGVRASAALLFPK